MTKSFAIVIDNKVIDTVVADTLEIAEEVTNRNCIEIPEGTIANIGWTYNGSTFESLITE
jgi:hypothetical protein